MSSLNKNKLNLLYFNYMKIKNLRENKDLNVNKLNLNKK